eukprot:364798-Chlamydomonas_euryale.AAC.15
MEPTSLHEAARVRSARTGLSARAGQDALETSPTGAPLVEVPLEGSMETCPRGDVTSDGALAGPEGMSPLMVPSLPRKGCHL